MESLPAIDVAITALTVIAGFALLVERTVEGLKHLIGGGLADAGERAEAENRRDAAARALDDVARIRGVAGASPNDRPEAKNGTEDPAGGAPPEDTESETATSEAAGDEWAFENAPSVALKGIPVPSQQARSATHLQAFYLLAALGLALILASCVDLRVLDLLMGQTPAERGTPAALLDQFLTALIIAGGSQPVHLLLRFLTSRRPPQMPAGEDESAEQAPAAAPDRPSLESPQQPTPDAAAADWKPISYKGGVKPESLENRNRRGHDPELIVYHHTAMSSASGFQAVVDEFLVNKGWSTGYHCVIMPDGAIRPFCRWDRVGNHTKGLNFKSLGVAFHGNFHTEPGDNHGNHDGRYGNTAPTAAQLEAGARVIALWTFLYGIAPGFDEGILAHRDAKPGHTVCPGSNFPHAELQQQVERFRSAWQASESAQAEIRAFGNQPYLYV